MDVKGGNLVSQIKRLSDRIFEKILTKENINEFNGAQGRILYALWQEDNISLKTLSYKTGLAATTLTSMVDRMENAGLVRRAADKNDRRKIVLALTDKAKSLKQSYNAVSNQMTSIFYQGFTQEEIEQCEAMLGRIYDNLKHNTNLK